MAENEETMLPVPAYLEQAEEKEKVAHSRVHTGYVGADKQYETYNDLNMFHYFCELSDKEPDKRVADLCREVAKRFNLTESTVFKKYKHLHWGRRYLKWRTDEKQLAVDDPRRKVGEMVKDLEKISKKGADVLYQWMLTLEPKKLVGKEVELISNLVLRSIELASKAGGVTTDNPAGINVKGHNVQLVIKE